MAPDADAGHKVLAPFIYKVGRVVGEMAGVWSVGLIWCFFFWGGCFFGGGLTNALFGEYVFFKGS